VEKAHDWNPDLYLKYRNERTQPSIDLINRIHVDFSPSRIIDIGCGPGNSTQVLAQRWPVSFIVGIDNSTSMIEKAKKDYPNQEWILADAATFSSERTYDVVFSNATIQWVPDHEQLIGRFCDLVSERGVLAVQIPKFRDMPLGQAIERVAQKPCWAARTKGCAKLFTYHDYPFYYDLLSKKIRFIEMWETTYIHVLDSQAAILDWTRGTGLRPYLDRISDDAGRQGFEEDVLHEVGKYYPQSENGKVLFPFTRLFFIGYKQG
jgi:trans-aconitate 2-methyltransferase